MTIRELIEKEMGKNVFVYNDSADEWVRLEDCDKVRLDLLITCKPKPTIRPFENPAEALPHVGRMVKHVTASGSVITGTFHIDGGHVHEWIMINCTHYGSEEICTNWTWVHDPNKGKSVGIEE